MIYHTIYLYFPTGAVVHCLCTRGLFSFTHTQRHRSRHSAVFSCVRARVRVCYGRTYVYQRVRASVSKRPPGIRAPPAGAKGRGPSGQQ